MSGTRGAFSTKFQVFTLRMGYPCISFSTEQIF
jgi:hypothetical protein